MKTSSAPNSLAMMATAVQPSWQNQCAACHTPADPRDLPITRRGTGLFLADEPWHAVGPNVYQLGLDENVIPPPAEPLYAPFNASYPARGRTTEIMATVRALGGTMVRAHTQGVSTGNPLSIRPKEGSVNEAAFESVDQTVAEARAYRVRPLVPLTDHQDYYHGGKYNFLRWAGFNLTQTANSASPLVQQLYTNPAIITSFKRYIHTLLAHVNKYTNLTYAEDPTIFAYESGNEPGGPVFGDMDVPVAWLREVGSYVRELAPGKLFVDGTYGVNRSHLVMGEVDLFSDHFYPVNMTKLREDLDPVSTAHKSYFAGEYDWVGSTGGGDSLTEWLSQTQPDGG